MDFDDSWYFVDYIDDCVHDFVQDLLIMCELTNMVSEKAEPLWEITREKGRLEEHGKPPPRKEVAEEGGIEEEQQKDHPHQVHINLTLLRLISVWRNLLYSWVFSLLFKTYFCTISKGSPLLNCYFVHCYFFFYSCIFISIILYFLTFTCVPF